MEKSFPALNILYFPLVLFSVHALGLSPLQSIPFPCRIDKKKELPEIIVVGETHYEATAEESFHHFMRRALRGEIIYLNEGLAGDLGDSPLKIPAGISLESGIKDFKDFVLEYTRYLGFKTFIETGKVSLFLAKRPTKEYMFQFMTQKGPPPPLPGVDPALNPFLSKTYEQFIARTQTLRTLPEVKVKIENALSTYLQAKAKRLDGILAPHKIPGMTSIEKKFLAVRGDGKKMKKLWQELGLEWRNYFMAIRVAQLYCAQRKHNKPFVVQVGSLHAGGVREYLSQWARNSELENLKVKSESVREYRSIAAAPDDDPNHEGVSSPSIPR